MTELIQCKCKLYSILLSLPDYELTENNLDLMEMLANDKDIQNILQTSLTA